MTLAAEYEARYRGLRYKIVASVAGVLAIFAVFQVYVGASVISSNDRLEHVASDARRIGQHNRELLQIVRRVTDPTSGAAKQGQDATKAAVCGIINDNRAIHGEPPMLACLPTTTTTKPKESP